MSTKAKGADAPIARRITVGLTEGEARELEVRARRAGLSLSRFLVDVALLYHPYVSVGIRHDFLPVGRVKVKVLDVVIGPESPPRLGDPSPRGVREGKAIDNVGRRIGLGEIVVWRCEGGLFRVATVMPKGLDHVGWFNSASEADDAVERLHARHRP